VAPVNNRWNRLAIYRQEQAEQVKRAFKGSELVATRAGVLELDYGWVRASIHCKYQ